MPMSADHYGVTRGPWSLVGHRQAREAHRPGRWPGHRVLAPGGAARIGTGPPASPLQESTARRSRRTSLGRRSLRPLRPPCFRPPARAPASPAGNTLWLFVSLCQADRAPRRPPALQRCGSPSGEFLALAARRLRLAFPAAISSIRQAPARVAASVTRDYHAEARTGGTGLPRRRLRDTRRGTGRQRNRRRSAQSLDQHPSPLVPSSTTHPLAMHAARQRRLQPGLRGSQSRAASMPSLREAVVARNTTAGAIVTVLASGGRLLSDIDDTSPG